MMKFAGRLSDATTWWHGGMVVRLYSKGDTMGVCNWAGKDRVLLWQVIW